MSLIPVIALTIVVIGSIVTFAYIKEKSSGYPMSDERTEKATGRAARVAIMIGSYSMLLMNFYNLFFYKMIGWDRIDGMLALNIGLIILNLSFALLSVFFNRVEAI